MKVRIEFEIDKKLDLIFAQIIQAISKIFGGFSIPWKYSVETSIEEFIETIDK